MTNEIFKKIPLVSRRRLLTSLGAMTFMGYSSAALADDLVLIVNPKNTQDPSSAELAAMFTTRKKTWEKSGRVVPFNFPPRHATRVRFDESVLKMRPDEVARYWIDRRIRGGNSPPKQVGNAQLIVRLVAKLEGSIAYVPRSAVNSSVRIVRGV